MLPLGFTPRYLLIKKQLTLLGVLAWFTKIIKKGGGSLVLKREEEPKGDIFMCYNHMDRLDFTKCLFFYGKSVSFYCYSKVAMKSKRLKFPAS